MSIFTPEEIRAKLGLPEHTVLGPVCYAQNWAVVAHDNATTPIQGAIAALKECGISPEQAGWLTAQMHFTGRAVVGSACSYSEGDTPPEVPPIPERFAPLLRAGVRVEVVAYSPEVLAMCHDIHRE